MCGPFKSAKLAFTLYRNWYFIICHEMGHIGQQTFRYEFDLESLNNGRPR